MHEISHDYPVDIETLWRDIVDFGALAESMDGVLTYEGLPTEPAVEGQVIVVKIKRWGWFPMGTWTMEIVRRDDKNHILESREHGGPVRCYRHRLEIVPIDAANTRYTDYLDVDAGILTPFLSPMFRTMYEHRHEARRARLKALMLSG